MSALSAKLRLKSGDRLYLPNAPAEVREALTCLTAVKSPGPYASLIFARTRGDLDTLVARLTATGDRPLWIAFPKKSSGMQTDLTMRQGWESLTRRGMRPVAMVSIDSTWAAARFRLRSEVHSRPGASSPAGEAARYVDPVRKSVRIPADLRAALAQQPAARALLDRLSYTHRREYVEWIVTAARPETRTRRVAQAVERLARETKQQRKAR